MLKTPMALRSRAKCHIPARGSNWALIEAEDGGNMTRVRHLIFDLDGTLVDSAPDLATALNGLLAERGKPALAESTVRAMVGDGAGVLVQRGLAASGLADADQPTALQRFLTLYRDCLIDRTRALRRSRWCWSASPPTDTSSASAPTSPSTRPSGS
jgi:hypothetical protein